MAADAPLVTAVVPAHNAERTIDETLWSVRRQTYANLEILVVDDGSRDATAAIVERHAAADPRVRLLRQPNGGVARARNAGIAASLGELVAPVDADDLWAPTKIARQVEALLAGGDQVGLVYTWHAIIDDESRVSKLSKRHLDEGRVVRRLCRGNLIGNGSAALMRKSAIVEAGGYDPSLHDANAQGCEDLLLYFRIAERHEFRLVPEHLTGYRLVRGAMSSDWAQMLASYWRVASEMKQKYPQYAAEIRGGDAEQMASLCWHAANAGKLEAATRLYVELLKRSVPHALLFGLRATAVALIRSVARPQGSAKAPFLAGAPTNNELATAKQET